MTGKDDVSSPTSVGHPKKVFKNSVNEEDITDDKTAETQNIRKDKCLVRKIVWTSIWVVCSTILLIYIYSTFSEYSENDPITIVAFVDQLEVPDPIVVTICSKNFLDQEKITDYNGTEFDLESVNFLKQIALGNFTSQHKEWVQPTLYGDVFLVSPRI